MEHFARRHSGSVKLDHMTPWTGCSRLRRENSGENDILAPTTFFFLSPFLFFLFRDEPNEVEGELLTRRASKDNKRSAAQRPRARTRRGRGRGGRAPAGPIGAANSAFACSRKLCGRISFVLPVTERDRSSDGGASSAASATTSSSPSPRKNDIAAACRGCRGGQPQPQRWPWKAAAPPLHLVLDCRRRCRRCRGDHGGRRRRPQSGHGGRCCCRR